MGSYPPAADAGSSPVPATTKPGSAGLFYFMAINMEEYVVYVLNSENFDKRYIGYTSSLINRFKSHNILGTKGWTIKYRPWKVLYVEFFRTKQEAITREKFLKSGQGREWLSSNISGS